MPLEKLRQHLGRGEYVQARREAERLIYLGELSGANLVQAYRGGALANYYLQEIFGAVKLGEKALELASQLEAWDLIGKLRYELGEFYLTLGDAHMALQHLQQCAADIDRYGDVPGLKAKLHHNLAHVYRHRRDFPRALASLHMAVDLYRQDGHRHLEMEALRAIIWCHLEARNPTAAWPYIQRVAAYLSDQSDPALSAGHLTDLAYYHRLTGDVRTSMNYCEEALVPGRPGVDDRILATACVITGENALDVGRYQEARMFANLAGDHALKAKHPYLMNMASALRKRIHQHVPCSACE